MDLPTLAQIEETRQLIDPYVVETPVWHWRNRHITNILGPNTQVFLKLELFQHTGTFKPRGALRVMLDLKPDKLARGVTAFSAGNHAIAVGYAAKILGTTAKVVMPKTANPTRMAQCRSHGAEVVLVENVHEAYDKVRQIELEEGRAFVHPFEGPLTALGTATVGLELCRQVPDLDAVFVPIGGGGLCAGIAAAIRFLQPRCRVFGVEPAGADTMNRSFVSGQPEKIDRIETIADSLGAPQAEWYSYSLCRRYAAGVTTVSDGQIRRAMGVLYQGVKLAVEPAGAAALAAASGGLRDLVRGQRVGLIVCGSNIDPASFAALLATEG